MHSRRDILKTVIGLGGAALAPLRTHPAFAAADSLESVRLTDNVVQIAGAGGNVVVLATADGLALADSGGPGQAEALMRFIGRTFGDAPVEALFNTHWHLPHTGANALIGARGAKIFAHENTRLWMSTEYYVDWEDKTYEPRPRSALPTDTFYSSDPQPLRYELGGRRVEYAHLAEAHTDGDIYVRFVDENVIVAGDVAAVGTYPLPDSATGGWIGGLEAATRKLIDLSDASTRIVPGTGPAQTRADLEAQLKMLSTVHQRVNALMIKGKSAEEMVAEGVTEGFDEAWGDPRQFISNVYDSMWWGGRVRGAI
jgi:cyclase